MLGRRPARGVRSHGILALLAAIVASLALAAPAGATTYLPGVDVSAWQGAINWARVARSGYAFTFAKASEGRSWVDPKYAANRSGAEAAGLSVGAYHFARPSGSTAAAVASDAATEADHFLAVATPRRGELPPVLDLEVSGGLSSTRLIVWTSAWLDEIEARLGVKAIIYTSPAFWAAHMANTTKFAAAGYKLLWIAHWTSAAAPWVPANNWGGNGWTFWQWTDCGSVPGISGCVDKDRYNGSVLAHLEIPLGAAARIAFTSDRSGTAQVYTRRATAGGGATAVTTGSASHVRPAWSPDGAALAFAGNETGNLDVYKLALAAAATPVNVSAHPAADTDPAWSPDGTKLAFASRRSGHWRLYVADVSTRTLTQVTNGPGAARHPSWAPDGTRLAFTSNAGGDWNVDLLDLASGRVTRLTTSSANDKAPAWSPDGTRIAFVSDRRGNRDVYVRDVAGVGGVKNVTTNAAADSDPAWSPDGAALLFASNRAGNWEIYIHSARSTWFSRLTRSAARDVQPVWQPKG